MEKMVHGVNLWGQLLPEKVQMEVLVTELLSGSTKKVILLILIAKHFIQKKWQKTGLKNEKLSYKKIQTFYLAKNN
jgi:hypothetical protein